MDPAKIHLSIQEYELVNNREWLLTKQDIINKVYVFFGHLHQQYKNIMAKEENIYPPGFLQSGGKISRGENYKGLPYLVLDYPAIFNKEDIFAIRTLFWWGNYFSISLHLSGKYLPTKNKLGGILSFLKTHPLYICINESQWEHHIDETGYIDSSQIKENQVQHILQKDFFKVAGKISLKQWEDAPQFLEGNFRQIIQLIQISFHQAGGKDL